MITLKVAGTPTLTSLSNLCITNYNCAQNEVEISPEFKANPFVIIKHNKPMDGAILVSIAQDNMSALATFMPAINGGNMPGYEAAMKMAFSQETGVLRELADEEAFKNAYDLAAANTLVYQTVIAVGRQPVNGTDGRLNLFFDLPSNRPDIHNAGKTNYRELNKYVNIRAEQLLARVILPTRGTPGLMVTGKAIPQMEGRKAEITVGDGVRISESGIEYYATIDGYITYKSNIVAIIPTIDIRDVDFSVGNIDFVGDINISGDVQPGFTVKGKNITINGICQDATIIADESLTIKVGAKGARSELALTAGGDITVGYCENYILNAKGNIIINKYAFNSDLNSGGQILAAETKSTVAGGKIIAFTGCSFYNLGTRANTNIEVIVGRKYDAEDKLSKINSEKTRLEQTLIKINEALAGIDLTNQKTLENIKVKKMVETRDLIVKRIDLFKRRIDSISSDANFTNPKIEVHNEVQEGAILKFHDIKYLVRSKLTKVFFFVDKATSMIDYKSL